MPRAPLRRQCAPSKARVQWVRSITRLEVPRKPPPSTKMATKRAQEIYAQRSRVAEFPHAWIKQHCGLRQFRCRGRLKACVEAMWAASNRLTRCRPAAAPARCLDASAAYTFLGCTRGQVARSWR